MLYDKTDGNESPIMISRGGGDAGAAMMGGFIWPIFALVLIFLALVFLWGRRDGNRNEGDYGMNAIAPILAATVASKAHGNDYGYSRDNYAFDLHNAGETRAEHLMGIRDTLIQSAETKERILQSQYALDQNIQRNHYDTLAVVKEDGEKTRALIVQQDREKMLAEIAYLKSRDMFHSFRGGNQAIIHQQQIGADVGYGYGY